MLSTATARQFKTTLKSVYARVTRNRLTATFFLFGFFHCFAQGIIQSFLFDIDSQYANLLSDITTAAEVPKRNHTFLEGTEGDYRLRMCDWIPHLPGNCTTISPLGEFDMDFELTAQQRGEVVSIASLNDTVVPPNQQSPSQLRSLFDTLIVIRPPTGNFSGVVIVNKEQPGFDVSLTTQCTSILTFPAQDLRNNMREDLAFVFLQFWLFFIAILAMISDSVPHVIAGVVARTLLTAWSAYALWRTNSKKLIYDELIQAPGTTCSVDLFPIYFKTRTNYEIPDLVLNVTALYIACHLSWTLFRDYSKQSFKTVGAPLHIIKMYKFYLAVQACLQLEVYILVVSMSLWIDQLINTYIGAISQHTWIYIGVFVFFNALVLPWLMLGWYAIRREHKLLMALFIFTAFLFFFTESIMFYADTYRWTFVSWANLACFTVASMILTGSSFILGIICMLNFNKGLAQYLHVESTLESINFAPEVFEHDITKHHITLVQSAGPQPNKLKKGYRLTNSALNSPKEKSSPYCMVMDDWIR